MLRNLHQGIYLLLQGEMYHGSQDCKSVLPYLQLKLSTLQLMKQVRDALVETVSPRIGYEAR